MKYFAEVRHDVGLCHSIGVIMANPEQSKHLETATTKIFGYPIDFCNLRCETYADDSRIPQIRIGTPIEDAHRRDLTINSLFYRIDTRVVEDLTEKGLQDLKDGIIRTPLAPLETFTDDPLRVLRTVRFMARFGFKILPEIIQAARNPAVKEAFQTKVSRERIGKEMSLMFGTQRCDQAMSVIMEMGIFDFIMQLPQDLIVPPPSSFDARGILIDKEMNFLLGDFYTKFFSQVPSSFPLFVLSPDLLRALNLSSLLFYLNGSTVMKKGRPSPVLSFVIVENSLKMSVKDDQRTQKFISCANLLRNELRRKDLTRCTLGLAVFEGSGEWRESLLLALSVDLAEMGVDEKIRSGIISEYQNFVKKIEELDLSRVHELKPLFTGTEIASLYGVRPGKWVGGVLTALFHWQLDHPGMGKELAAQWLLSCKTEMLGST
eukprot:TRINITY_DN10119_c0_g1_i1.p1 TRINITY_DN10119_c0_g1~~TRINITY_DN10119_c0_g1_i1.p1  ORF type:complete len:433 (+),score=75.41 TRINITY_DN10119_c0_g1_i1:89-1387(+)